MTGAVAAQDFASVLHALLRKLKSDFARRKQAALSKQACLMAFRHAALVFMRSHACLHVLVVFMRAPVYKFLENVFICAKR